MKINLNISNAPETTQRIDAKVDDVSTIYDDGFTVMLKPEGGEIDLGVGTPGKFLITARAYSADGVEIGLTESTVEVSNDGQSFDISF